MKNKLTNLYEISIICFALAYLILTTLILRFDIYELEEIIDKKNQEIVELQEDVIELYGIVENIEVTKGD